MQPNDNLQTSTTEINIGATSQAPQTAPINPSKNKPKKNTGIILGVIFLILLAAGGAGFGTWAYLSGNQEKEQLNSRIEELKQQNDKLQEELDSTSTTIDNDSTEATNTEEYVYVGKWGVKFKIPDQLKRVKYSFYNEYHSGFKFETDSLCVSGQSKEGIYRFNNTIDGAYVCISRNYGAGAGVENENVPQYLIHPEGEYFIQNPQAVISLDEESKAVELESLELIRSMLSEENMTKI
ncbi:MAG: hypothetical protein Q4A70_04240 [Candidatus Saccharibacteria bacterium]|nr:hypothetical protein [Candidatus Saccharibacteria bacterium]